MLAYCIEPPRLRDKAASPRHTGAAGLCSARRVRPASSRRRYGDEFAHFAAHECQHFREMAALATLKSDSFLILRISMPLRLHDIAQRQFSHGGRLG